MIEELKDLYAYNVWANERIVNAAEELDPDSLVRDLGSSFPSVRDTLRHILLGEWVWMERWDGRSPTGPPNSWDLSTLPAIRMRWRTVAERHSAFVSGLEESSLARVVPYRDIRGNSFEAPLGQLLLHVVNHSTYHRGQVTTLFRQLGKTAPSTDLVVFHRERAGPGG